MNISDFSRFALSGMAAATLAGCGGSQPPIGAPGAMPQSLATCSATVSRRHGPRSRGWLSTAATNGRDLIYFPAEFGVYIYPERGRNHAPIGEITSGVEDPYGLYVDRHRNLYVVNDLGYTVTVYPPGSLQPSATYQGLCHPLFATVDRAGHLFVGNAYGGAVVEFLPGNPNPYRTIQTAGSEADGLGFDSAGNLYVAYRASGGASIERFAPHAKQGHILGMHLNQPQGLVIDELGNIVVAETAAPQDNFIDVFPPGSIAPSQRRRLRNMRVPTELALSEPPRRELYFSDYATGNVYVAPYPLRQSRNWFHPKILAQYRLSQGVALSNQEDF
jgi:hypothetical protein